MKDQRTTEDIMPVLLKQILKLDLDVVIHVDVDAIIIWLVTVAAVPVNKILQ